ncbi:MAG: radical SAM protein [Candidatus Wallbacteria bacterium]|nr:radical SAM protein [Candidatus Wallbacteria bacterium]
MMCDWEGRILCIVRGGRTYRRGLGGSVLEKGYLEGKRWVRVESDPIRLRSLLEEAFALVEEAVPHVLAGEAASSVSGTGHSEELRCRLENWNRLRSVRNPGDLERDRRRFLQVCQSPPILPPDQYRAVVVQVTTGCPWNACRFCSLYSERTYRVLEPEELRRHARDVTNYFGAGLSYRQSVFLGDASLSRLTPGAVAQRAQLVAEVLRETMPKRRWLFNGFADAFTPAAWPADALAPLHEAGVQRFHIGVESGSQAVLDAAGKPQSPEKVFRLVKNLKSGGLSVSCIFIVGLGGSALRDEHVAASVRLLERLPLGAGDFVYLSPLVGSPPGRPAAAPSDSELAEEEATLRRALEPSRAAHGFRVARYDLREFVY